MLCAFRSLSRTSNLDLSGTAGLLVSLGRFLRRLHGGQRIAGSCHGFFALGAAPDAEHLANAASVRARGSRAYCCLLVHQLPGHWPMEARLRFLWHSLV